MAKRKPPSQRPELQMDETAKAIARLREEAKAPKPTPASTIDSSKPNKRQVGQSLGPQRVGGTTSHKRQKSG